jgi:uncharacterized protein (DUF1697 family)
MVVSVAVAKSGIGMKYLALLRGINVGGKNKVDMRTLKATFEKAGMSEITTYINSGNVIFNDGRRKPPRIVAVLEEAIAADFGLPIKVLIRDLPALKKVIKALPDTWTTDTTMRCDVMFLWEGFDRKDILKELKIKPEIEDVTYVPGAIIWRVDRSDITKSGMMKLVGTDLYKGMTIRNSNTVRKLAGMMAMAPSLESNVT